MANIILSGTMTTVAPISILLPETGPAIMPVSSAGGSHDTAYIPATTLRGTMRRAVTFALMQEASTAKHPWKLAQVYDRLLGQNAESEESAEVIDLEAIRAARAASPIIDTFGSGLGLKSSLEVSHAIPLVPTPPALFKAVRKDLDADPESLELLDESERQLWEGRTSANSRRAKLLAKKEQLTRALRKVADAEKDGMNAKIAELDALIQVATDQMGDISVATKLLTEYRALPAGVVCSQSMRLMHEAPSKTAILIAALNYLSMNPVLGGQRARGCGEIKAEYEIRRVDGFTSSALGTLRVGGFQKAEFTAADDSASRWYEDGLSAWEAMLASERTAAPTAA